MASLHILRGVDNFWATACFLVDALCLGVKDCFARLLDNKDVQKLSNKPMTSEINYELARGFILGSVEFAAQAKIQPHPNWDTCNQLIDCTSAYTLPPNFSFGKNGKHYYVAGQYDHELFDVKKVIKKVKKAGGEYLDEVDIFDLEEELLLQ